MQIEFTALSEPEVYLVCKSDPSIMYKIKPSDLMAGKSWDHWKLHLLCKEHSPFKLGSVIKLDDYEFLSVIPLSSSQDVG